MAYVATAYPFAGPGEMYISARTRAVLVGPKRATIDEATRDATAYDELGLAFNGRVSYFVEVADGSEGGEDPVSRGATQITS